MSRNQSRISQFWQELKRRRVHRLMAIYAGSAYVIFEASTLIFPRWGLPDWTVDLVLYLLLLGAIVTFILGWIYDITPDGIQKTEPVSETTKKEAPPTPNGWKIASYISIVVIVVLIVLNIIPRADKREVLDKSIAVLPFYYYNMDEEAEDIGDAFSNEIITQLYKVKGFDKVISHTSTLQYKGADRLSIPEIGKELNANYVIEGSLERQNEDVSIQIQIIEAANDDHIWADEFRGKWSDIFSIRSGIAKRVASELKTILSPNEIEQLEKWPTKSPEAYELYLLGNRSLFEFTEESLLTAIEYYEAAIELDTEFALAYVKMSDAYRSLFWNANWFPAEAYGKAREMVLKALEINDQLAEAHSSLATINLEFDWDFEVAEREYRKAIDLNQNLVDAYVGLADLMDITCHYDEYYHNIRQALTLYPNSNGLHAHLGYGYYLIGKIDTAYYYLEEQIRQHPNTLIFHYLLGYIYLDAGDYPKAIEHLEKAVDMNSVSQPYRLYLGIAYARAGMLEETRKHLEAFDALESESRTVTFGKAVLLAELGDVDQAVYWLQRAYEERYQHLLYLNTAEMMFEPIRSDPRFIEIYNKVFQQK